MAVAKSNFSHKSARRSEAGFSIVEVIVATGLLASALVALAQLFAISTTTNAAARSSTLTMVLAEQKIEQLRALQYTFDRAGLPVQDTETDLAVYPPAATRRQGAVAAHRQHNTGEYRRLRRLPRPLRPDTWRRNRGSWRHRVHPPVVCRAAPDQPEQRDHSSGAGHAAARSRNRRCGQRCSRAERGPSHDH